MHKQIALVSIKALVATLCVLASQQSLASAYVGGAIGQADGALEYVDHTTSIEVFGGYKFSDFFAMEGSYLNLGKTDYGYGDITIAGFTGAFAANLPLADTVNVFAKMGFYSWETTYSEDNRYSYYYETLNDDTNLFYGVGVSFSITNNFDAVVQYKKIDFDFDEEGASNVSLGVQFNFR